jgi:hypothetical protein
MYFVLLEVVNLLHAGVCLIKPSSDNILPWYCKICVIDWGPAVPCSPLLANPFCFVIFALLNSRIIECGIICLGYVPRTYCVRAALHAVQVSGVHSIAHKFPNLLTERMLFKWSAFYKCLDLSYWVIDVVDVKLIGGPVFSHERTYLLIIHV